MNKSDCVGCRDDFYNGNNDIGVSECWLFKKAELATRYQLSIHTPISERRGYRKVTKPKCYGQNGYVFLDKIPEHAK